MDQLRFFTEIYDVNLRQEETHGVREVLGSHAADEKLLAHVLGHGGERVCKKLFNTYPNLKLIANAELQALVEIIGPRAAEKVYAIMALATKFLASEVTRISGPEDVYQLMKPRALLEKEHFWVITLNTKLQVIGVHEIYKGSINAITQFRLAELFKPAIAVNAASIICVHNHPTSEVNASPEDLNTTREIVRAGRLLDLRVADHIIIGKGYRSLRETHPSVFSD
jgi:DNA repair protein RadC